MASLDLDQIMPALDILSAADTDRVFNNCLLRILKHPNIAEYIETHPTAYDRIAAAIRSIPRATPLITPASTPCHADPAAEDHPTPLPVRNPTAVHDNLPIDDQQPSSPFIQQIAQKSRPAYQAYVEDYDNSENEQTSRASERSASIDGPDRKRKQEDAGAASKRLRIGVEEEPDLGSPSNKSHVGHTTAASRELRLMTQDAEDEEGNGSDTEEYGSQSEEDSDYDSDYDNRSASPTLHTKTRRRSSKHSRSDPVDTPDFGQRFAQLKIHIRSEAQKIKSAEGLKSAWHFFHSCRHPVTFHDTSADGTDSKQHLKMLRSRIEKYEKWEASITVSAVTIRALRRLHLVELKASFAEEKKAWAAAPKGKHKKEVSPNERFTDILFPETIIYKLGDKKKKKGGNKAGNDEQVSNDSPRRKAEDRLAYWLRLGTSLLQMVQRFGYGILPLLPKDLTDKDLQLLPCKQVEVFVDYIDLCHPRLKEQISNMSDVVQNMIESGLPSQLLVLETASHQELSELSNRPFGDVFQFALGTSTLDPEHSGTTPLRDETSPSLQNGDSISGQVLPVSGQFALYPALPSPLSNFVHLPRQRWKQKLRKEWHDVSMARANLLSPPQVLQIWLKRTCQTSKLPRWTKFSIGI